jgi:outer membrane immunogenic protein
MKKTLTILSLAAFSLSASACELYAGLGIGPDYAKFQRNAKVSQTLDGVLNFNVKDDNQFAGTGMFGTVFAGVGSRFKMPYTLTPNQNAYLALELNVDKSKLKYQLSNVDFVSSTFASTIYRMNHSYGASLLPGFVFRDTALFYGRLGYSRGDIQVITTDTTLGNLHQNMNGFRWGLGIRQMLTTKFAARMEYSHVAYRNVTSSTLNTNNVVKTTRITPQTNAVEFSVLYLFD